MVGVDQFAHRGHLQLFARRLLCGLCGLHDELVDQREFYSFFNYIYNNYLRI
jgi:hypothetical protein